jgi:hypothetical protein
LKKRHRGSRDYPDEASVIMKKSTETEKVTLTLDQLAAVLWGGVRSKQSLSLLVQFFNDENALISIRRLARMRARIIAEDVKKNHMTSWRFAGYVVRGGDVPSMGDYLQDLRRGGRLLYGPRATACVYRTESAALEGAGYHDGRVIRIFRRTRKGRRARKDSTSSSS